MADFMKGTVSIVIPVYNAERFLDACLKSVEEQTYPHYEAIIVNDGSTDGSREIAESFCRRDPRFKLFDKENGGLSSARNLGIDNSRGEWLFFLDSDDELYPESIKRLMEIQSTADTDIAIARWAFATEKPLRGANGKTEVLIYEKAVETALYQHVILNSVEGGVYRRSLFCDLCFVEGLYYEDLQIFYRLFEKAGQIAYSPEYICFYRDHGSSFTNTFSKKRLDAITVTDEIVEYMAENHPSLLPAALDRQFSAHYNMLTLLWTHPDAPSVLSEDVYRRYEQKCLNLIKRRRLKELADPKVRLKNKLGAALAFLPDSLLKKTVRLLSRNK